MFDKLFEGMSLPPEAFVPNGAQIERENIARMFGDNSPELVALLNSFIDDGEKLIKEVTEENNDNK